MAGESIEHETDKFIDKLKWALGVMLSIAKMGPDFVRYKMIPWAFGKTYEWGREKWRERRLKNQIERANLTIKYRPAKAKKENTQEQKVKLQKALEKQQATINEMKKNSKKAEAKVEGDVVDTNAQGQGEPIRPVQPSSSQRESPTPLNRFAEGGRGRPETNGSLARANGPVNNSQNNPSQNGQVVGLPVDTSRNRTHVNGQNSSRTNTPALNTPGRRA